MYNKKRFNTGLHIAITLISIALYFMPLVFGIMSFLSMLIVPFGTKSELFVVVSVAMLVIGMGMYTIATVIIPIIQLILSLIAAANMKWGMFILNLLSMIILCVITYVNMDLFFNRLVYST